MSRRSGPGSPTKDMRRHRTLQRVPPTTDHFVIRGLAPRRAGLASVDLLADECDGALVDRSGVPGLDGGKIGLAGLISRARAPAMTSEEIRRRGQRAVGRVQISPGPVVEDALR